MVAAILTPDDFRRSISTSRSAGGGPASQKVLTEQLRELIADELVVRESTGPVPAPVRYSLTEYGHSVVPIVEAVRRWGRGHIERFAADGAE
jgi:DNA-binding HxlR family transcriptional regulator